MVLNGSMDSAMIEPPSATDLSASASNPTINPSIIPLRVNGLANLTFTSAYDPATSAQVSPVNEIMTPPWHKQNDPDDTVSDEDNHSIAMGGAKVGSPVCKPNPLPSASLKTGLCYDSRMSFHQTLTVGDNHPEDPQRILAIYKALLGEGLVEESKHNGVDTSSGLMFKIGAREARREEVLRVHSEEHWMFLESTASLDSDALEEISADGDSVYYNQSTFLSAKLSCGGAIETCRAVVTGAVKNAIAVIRPPGHHAEPCKAMGFCMFNNVSVAARVMQAEYPEKCQRILILDWDVHHGNGTQSAFYDDPSILYMSIHRHGKGFYPHGPAGDYNMCGEGGGLGMNVNVPWPRGGMGDGDYMYAFQRVVMPIALEFNPDLVIISAGFDAAAGDVLGECFVTPAGYAHMTHMLMELAEGKVVVCLEGGYNLQSISNSAVAVTKVLMGEPPGRLQDEVASQIAVEVVHKCALEQSRFWRCLKPRQILPADQGAWKIDRLNDVIRLYQSSMLYHEYKMTPLPILREIISRSFEAQVVATPDFHRAETIIYIVHDPPPVCALPDSHTNEIALHDAYMIDHVGNVYVDWAVEAGFAVIDANIPRALTGRENKKYEVSQQTEELCTYIWDNYLELTDAKNIFFIGVGEAFGGLVHLLTHRDCRHRVRGCVSLIGDNSLRAIPRSCVDSHIHEWYYCNSLVVVNKGHHALRGKRLSKRFGNIVQSSSEDLEAVLRTSFDDVKGWIAERIISTQN